MINIVFLGAPGSGKGTQASIIQKKLNIPKFSTGDILRQMASQKSDLSLKLKKIMDAGDLVPDELILQVIENKITSKDCQNGFILDGFPRTLIQARTLDDIFVMHSYTKLKVLRLKVSDEEIVKRLSGRFTCKNCGASYHKESKLPIKDGICDECGSIDFVYREDDSEESIKHRLSVYNEQTYPLVQYYNQQGSLFDIDAMRGVDEISYEILSKISQFNGV